MGLQLFFVRICGHSTIVPCFCLRRNEAQGRTAMCCVSYGVAQASCSGWGGILALCSFARPFLHPLDIYNVVLADSRRWGRCVILAGGAQNGASLGFGTLLAR